MLINYTPHKINIFEEDDVEYIEAAKSYFLKNDMMKPSRVYDSKGIARCATSYSLVISLDDIPVVSLDFGDIEGLPEPKDDVWYIVSTIVMNAAKKLGRVDTLAPARLVRNSEGSIVGCLALSM